MEFYGFIYFIMTIIELKKGRKRVRVCVCVRWKNFPNVLKSNDSQIKFRIEMMLVEAKGS